MQENKTFLTTHLEQVAGIEPAINAWEALVLPLNYTCMVEAVGVEPTSKIDSTNFSTRLVEWKI